MTLKELSQLYYLNLEIERDQEQLKVLRAKASDPSGSKITGMPAGGGHINLLERYAAEIVDLEAIIAAKQQRCIHERNRLERYIASIPDSLTRQIFQLRFVNGLSWVKIAFSLGGGNTESSVKMICYRYIKKSNE